MKSETSHVNLESLVQAFTQAQACFNLDLYRANTQKYSKISFASGLTPHMPMFGCHEMFTC